MDATAILGQTYQQKFANSQVSTETQKPQAVEVSSQRAEVVSAISKEIVFAAALQDVMKGDRLAFFNPAEITQGEKGRKALNVIKALGNGIIRGFEAATGIKAVRLVENQLLATQALERLFKYGQDSLSAKEEQLLRKLNLARYLERGGEVTLKSDIEAGKKIQKAKAVGPRESQQKEEKGVIAKVTQLFGLTKLLDEEKLRGIYLSLPEDAEISAKNKELRKFVAVTVYTALGVTLVKAKALSVSWVLAGGLAAGYATIRGYERSKIATEAFLQKMKYEGFDAAPFVASEGVKQTLIWGLLGSGARQISKYFDASSRLKENEAIRQIVSQGDLQLLSQRIESNQIDGAIEVLARNYAGLISGAQNIQQLAELLGSAEEKLYGLNGTYISQLNIRIAQLIAEKEYLDKTIQVENLRDSSRAALAAIAGFCLGTWIRDMWLAPETVQAAPPSPVEQPTTQVTTLPVEQRVTVLDASEPVVTLPKVETQEVVAQAGTGSPKAVYRNINLDEDLIQRPRVATTGILLQEAPAPKSPVIHFSFDDANASELAQQANAYAFRSDADFFSNVPRTDSFQPDYQVRIPGKFGNGDGTFTPSATENLEFTLTGKFHGSAKGLLAEKGLIKPEDYNPENVGYSVYIKEGNHNLVLTVTKDSNITGLKVGADGKLIVDPMIQSKIDGVTIVYVDKDPSGKMRNIFNLGRYLNKNKRIGKPDFQSIDLGTAQPPKAPIIPEGKPISPTGEPLEAAGEKFNVNDPVADAKLAQANAIIIRDESAMRNLYDSSVTNAGHIKAGTGFEGQDTTYFKPNMNPEPGTAALLIEDNGSTENLIKDASPMIEQDLNIPGFKLTPQMLKWDIEFFDKDKKRFFHILVDRNTKLAGIKVTDKGLELSEEYAKKLVEVKRIAFLPNENIVIDRIKTSNLQAVNEELPEFVPVK